MNPAHQRRQASTSSVRSFDESNEHATDYISGMYYSDFSAESLPPLKHTGYSTPSPPRKKEVPSLHTRTSPPNQSLPLHAHSPSASPYDPTSSSQSASISPERRSPTLTRPRLRAPSPPPPLATQLPLSGLNDDDDGSSPSSPAEIAKELSNLQAFKRMSLDVSNQVSDPDLPSNNRMSIPDFSELMEAGVDENAARLLWVPAHLHPEIAANDDWKDFVQRRVEETKSTGTISRVKSISGAGSHRRLSRAKSILSRQIDPSDEDTYARYSDAGHRELEQRSSRDTNGPPERPMITVAGLEKLESLIKEGALERPGRPTSGEGIETLEVITPLAADVSPSAEDIPPLIPMKGTLKRSAHTSMRNVRRGGLSAVRTVRRSSEPKKDSSRMSQASASEEDGILRPEIVDTSKISPALAQYEKDETMLPFELDGSDPYRQTAPLEVVDKTNPSSASGLPKLDFQNLTPLVPDIFQSPEPMTEQQDIVLGQVQPRQLRRPPLRRQTIDAPESITLQPPASPTKDKTPDKPLKKSPVSPLFPTSEAPRQDASAELQPAPSYPPYLQSLPTPSDQPASSPQTSTTKKGAWSRLFTSASDDDTPNSSKDKSQGKSKMKKAASYSERSKPSEMRIDGKSSLELDRGKTVPAATTLSQPVAPPAPSVSQKQSGKKESGLFASIFGSKKKSQDPKEKSKSGDSPAIPNKSGARDRSQYQRNGHGARTDSGNEVMDSPALNYYYTRFPIHVERAIYRLSHIKLANPRRPLLQQVLLSNFMYGYLNLINKAAQPQPQEPQQPQTHQHETYEDSQPEDHVFYSQEDQNDYYNQDYYGSQYEDDQDDSVPHGHESEDSGYGNPAYQSQPATNISSSHGPSSSRSLSHTQDHPNSRRYNSQESDDETTGEGGGGGGATFILRDSRGRTLSLPKSAGTSLGGANSWAGGGQDEPAHTGKRYH